MIAYSIPLTYLTGSSFIQPAGTCNDYSHMPRPLHSIAYVLRGGACFVYEDKRYVLRPGDVVYVAKGCRYSSLWTGEPETELLSCHFDLVPFGAPVGNRVYPLQSIPDSTALLPLFQEIVWGASGDCSDLHAIGSFLQLLSVVFPRMRYDCVQTVNDRIVEAVRYIEAHYDAPLCVSELAALCHISPSYFYECFRKEMGTSPIDYKNKIMIRHAERGLLDHPEVPIEELSEQLGFRSAIYFRRLFKAETGKTPREYRRTMRGSL